MKTCEAQRLLFQNIWQEKFLNVVLWTNKLREEHNVILLDIFRLGGKGVKPKSKKKWTTNTLFEFLQDSGPKCSLLWGGGGGVRVCQGTYEQ